MAIKAKSTQSLVNAFPEWSKVRSDEQSLGYQLINSIGIIFDKYRKQLKEINNNYYLTTANLADVDVYYEYQLPTTYEFTKQDDDDTEFIYTPPTVSGIYGGSVHAIEIAENNDIESFWYSPYPDRVSLATTITGDHFVGSGFINSSPISMPNFPDGLHLTNKLTITISGGTNFVDINDAGFLSRGLVQINGKNREGTELTEELIFIQNETQQTINDFSEILSSGIRVYGIEDKDTATVYLTSAHFNDIDYSTGEDFLVTLEDNYMPLFWAISSGVTSSITTLDLKKYDIDDIELRIQGFTTKQTILQQELLNTAGSNIYPRDLTVEPNSDKLWLVDSGTLYVYDNSLPYHDMTQLSGKNYDASCIIEPNTYYTTIGDSVDIDYIWARPALGLVAHRAWVVQPNGNKYSIEDGSLITYHVDSSSWVYGEPLDRKLRGTNTFVLSQRGDYIFSLEAKYTDGSTSIDKRIVSVLYKKPQGEYSLTYLGITNAYGVDFDSEYNLWITNGNGTYWKINRHYDKMLVDFERKKIYFREPYTRIRVYE